jgi:hypothetical protein
MDWDPVERLKDLLGPVPTHPWCALIPQLLLWSFRRFCIEKLVDGTTVSLLQSVWDDHTELIQLYAPKGLQNVAGSWLTPDTLGKMHEPPESYNVFFLDYLGVIDDALKGGDVEMQDKISDFLDTDIREVFAEWLGSSGDPKHQCLLIYPQREEDDDVFTDAQFMALIQSLLTMGNRGGKGKAAVAPAPAEAPVPVPEAPSEPAAPVAAPAPAPQEKEPQEAQGGPQTVAEALRKRRHTFRRHGPRANRGVTLRSGGRARTNTRKVHLSP